MCVVETNLSYGIDCQKAYNSINIPENSLFYIVDCWCNINL